jgi:hypothetical protein
MLAGSPQREAVGGKPWRLARIMHDARRFCMSVEQARAGNSIAGSL